MSDKPTKSRASAREIESPVLTRHDVFRNDWSERDHSGFLWVCATSLSELFEIKNAKEIVLVAKRRPDKSTYEVALTRDGDIKKPVRAYLYQELRFWLRDQIAAGRPHIGVRIIK